MQRHTKNGGKDDLLHSALLVSGILAMVLLVYSITFLNAGTLPQKLCLLTGATILFFVAYLNEQNVWVACQIIVMTGGILSLIAILSITATLAITVAISAMLVIYLSRTGHYRKEPIGVIGTAGFILLAIGFATNTASQVVISSFGFACGGILLALYASIHYMFYRVKTQLIFFVLNAAFCISPLLVLISIAHI